jgi:hypothetical protein
MLASVCLSLASVRLSASVGLSSASVRLSSASVRLSSASVHLSSASVCLSSVSVRLSSASVCLSSASVRLSSPNVTMSGRAVAPAVGNGAALTKFQRRVGQQVLRLYSSFLVLVFLVRFTSLCCCFTCVYYCWLRAILLLGCGNCVDHRNCYVIHLMPRVPSKNIFLPHFAKSLL